MDVKEEVAGRTSFRDPLSIMGLEGMHLSDAPCQFLVESLVPNALEMSRKPEEVVVTWRDSSFNLLKFLNPEDRNASDNEQNRSIPKKKWIFHHIEQKKLHRVVKKPKEVSQKSCNTPKKFQTPMFDLNHAHLWV
jgi:hypothetical protein